MMSDSQFDIFSEVSRTIGASLVDGSKARWIGSPFEWILALPSRSKGAVGEKLVAEWCIHNGLLVERSPSTQADRIINGHRIEIKLSTLWAGNSYRFQQIRDQDYEHLLCLGLSPNEVHCWLLPKDLLHKYVIRHMGQHTGATGKDTAWLEVNPLSVPDWLSPFGSDLENVLEMLRRLGRGRF